MANITKVLDTTIHVGDIVAVYQKIKEGNKERTQVFKGAVIAIKGKASGKSFTVRRIASNNIGVERIWPVLCPSLEKIKVIRKGKVKRAKLYYLRHKVGKQAVRIKTKETKKAETEVKTSKKPSKKRAKNKKTKKPKTKATSKKGKK